MGIVSELAYEVPQPNVLQRAMWKVSGSAPGAWFFSKTLNAMDRVVMRLTRRRTTVPTLLAGLPVVEVTMTGARTGLRRTLPLLGIPVGDDIALIGTNFGQQASPSWVRNLAANPAVEVGFRGRTVAAKARELDGAEHQAAFQAGRQVYGGYQKYLQRIGDSRPVRIFLLEVR